MNYEQEQLRRPAMRRGALRAIQPTRECAAKNREWLLQIFAEEMKYREHGDDEGSKYFENIYWCAFLLYLAGDPSDVPLIWEAKEIDMDTYSGMDDHFFVGAGVEATLAFLKEKCDGIANHIEEQLAWGEYDDLEAWERWAAQYYYALEP